MRYTCKSRGACPSKFWPLIWFWPIGSERSDFWARTNQGIDPRLSAVRHCGRSIADASNDKTVYRSWSVRWTEPNQFLLAAVFPFWWPIHGNHHKNAQKADFAIAPEILSMISLKITDENRWNDGQWHWERRIWTEQKIFERYWSKEWRNWVRLSANGQRVYGSDAEWTPQANYWQCCWLHAIQARPDCPETGHRLIIQPTRSAFPWRWSQSIMFSEEVEFILIGSGLKLSLRHKLRECTMWWFESISGRSKHCLAFFVRFWCLLRSPFTVRQRASVFYNMILNHAIVLSKYFWAVWSVSPSIGVSRRLLKFIQTSVFRRWLHCHHDI